MALKGNHDAGRCQGAVNDFQSGPQFTCSSCGFHVRKCRKQILQPMEKHSKTPAQLIFKEDAYILDDPFSPNKTMPLVVGSVCINCNAKVCLAQECSIYYTKRICISCARENIDKFPEEIKKEIEKKSS